MFNPNKKCTSKEHEKIDANTFCQECNIYIYVKNVKIFIQLLFNLITPTILMKISVKFLQEYVKNNIIQINLNIFVRLIMYYVALHVLQK